MSAVFAIDKDKVKRSFASAASSYDGLATLQRKVGLDLLSKLSLICSSWVDADKTFLDIGCGTGFLTHELMLKKTVQQMVAFDIAWSMLQVTRSKLQYFDNVQYVCADAEQLPLLSHSVDMIVSNLALQWCQDLASVFDGFNKILKQEGRLLFSTFGPATLKELKQAWAEVDDYSHVNEFYSADELLVFLQQAGFINIQIEVKHYQSNYQTVVELMRELKGIGAQNVLSGRHRGITSKSRLQKMVTAYEKHRINECIPATYEIIMVSAEIER